MLVFISDTHLGNHFSKVSLLKSFLSELKKQQDIPHLYLVGDIVDFWRDPKLGEFSEIFRGFNITYVTGNHDKQMEFASMFSYFVKKDDFFTLGGIKIKIQHMLDLDKFSDPGCFIHFLDSLLYEFSKFINFNIKDYLFSFYGKWFYNSYLRYNDNIFDSFKDSYDVLITGHSHLPGLFIKDNFKIFNLGSWIQEPYAFIIKDAKYAFYPIKESYLFPPEKDFNDFWRY